MTSASGPGPRWPPNSPCYTYSCIPAASTFDSPARAVTTTVKLRPVGGGAEETFTYKYIPRSASASASRTSTLPTSRTAIISRTSTLSTSVTSTTPTATPRSTSDPAAALATTAATASGTTTPPPSSPLRVALPIAGAAVLVLLIIALAFMYRRRRRPPTLPVQDYNKDREVRECREDMAVAVGAPRLRTPDMATGLGARFEVSAAEFGVWPALAKVKTGGEGGWF
ncbi:hypothetical protein EDC01DRAFT_791584 [Geopyxis carbonaria]|nr:hypothetical protein EDC01DRAFT_791584 [Geopyxis carbonaria]